MVEIETPGEWEEANWKCLERGNYQNHIGEINDGDVMVWVYKAGSSYGVKTGTGTRLSKSTHVATNLDNENMAVLKAVEFMQNYPTKDQALDNLN